VRYDLDLWPHIQAQVGATPWVRRPVLHTMVIAAAGAVLALGLTIACVPAARASVESVVQRLGLAFIDTATREARTSTVVKLEPSPVPGGRLMTWEEIEREAPFQVRTPAWLPDGLALAGGSVGKGQVYLQYRLAGSPAGSETPCLMQSIWAGPVGAPPLLPASQEVAVEVRGQPAIYVHGGWRDDGQGDAQVAIGGTLRWDGSLDSAWLTWKEGELTYLLAAHGLQLDLDQMIRIAESLE
jgi:hypothetical protein